MRKLTLLFSLLLLSLYNFAQKDSVEATVVKFFDGLAELNEDKLRAHTTSDFILLEDGEDDKQQTVNWLESAVLLRQGVLWRIKMLHSTRKH